MVNLLKVNFLSVGQYCRCESYMPGHCVYDGTKSGTILENLLGFSNASANGGHFTVHIFYV